VWTRVGYTGGSMLDPTYHDLGDHSESVEVAFDPTVISYDRLLTLFLASHDPTMPSPTQYRSAIFVHDAAQRISAERALKIYRGTHTGMVMTKIEDAGVFYPAEDYHQKWYLRHSGAAWTEFQAIYPDIDDLTHSTAAARVNGWVGEGKQPASIVAKALPDVGLSEATGKALLERM
jgi:peptide-methionine (S)-S-oxide reductase